MAQPLTHLDRYRLVKVIGTGGFSTVYQAIDERFDTHVAIKVLAENHAFDPEIRERFITEVQLLRRLAGVPTVAVYDLGETPTGQPYAVMAMADGDLADRVRSLQARRIPVGPTEVDRVIDELTRSLSALHAKGIVHRDVKPMNLLVFGNSATTGTDMATVINPASSDPAHHGPRGTGAGAPPPGAVLLADSESLRLADLGFAKDLARQSGLTVAGGTPGFMPPEQVTPGQVDARADIYAATAVVAWLISGETPDKFPVEQIGPRVTSLLGPNSSADGLLAGMALNPDYRPDSMAQWRDLLRHTLIAPATTGAPGHQQTVGAIAPAPTGRTGSVSGSRQSRSRRMVVPAVVVAATLGVGAGAFGASILGGDGTERTQTEDGVVYTRSVDDVTVEVTGPNELTVGDSASFTAEVTGATEVRWVGPDGSLADGSRPLTLEAARVGGGQVKLIATAGNGEVVEVTADFTVVGSQ